MPDEEYIVVIQKTKVGDPTVAFQFNITPSEKASEERFDSLDIEVKLDLKNNTTGGVLADSEIDTSVSVSNSQQVLLMSSFASPIENVQKIGAKVVLSSPDSNFILGANSAYESVKGQLNTFEDDAISKVKDKELPGFVLPADGETKTVAFQSINPAGNYVFLTWGKGPITVPLFSSLDGAMVWELSNSGGVYTMINRLGQQFVISDTGDLKFYPVDSETGDLEDDLVVESKIWRISLFLWGRECYLEVDTNTGTTGWYDVGLKATNATEFFIHDLTTFIHVE